MVYRRWISRIVSCGVFLALTFSARSQTVTYQPYIQPGDNSGFGATDLIVVAWQTNETKPGSAYSVVYGTTQQYGSTATVAGRIVNNYLAADPSIPVPTAATGAKVNYTAVLSGLSYATTYYYSVTGPGLPSGGFNASFQTRKNGTGFSFLVQGDEGYFPTAVGSPAMLTDYEARIVNTMYNVANLQIAGLGTPLPKPDLALNTGDNVYTQGSEGSYRDYWMPVWNSDTASNDTGAPFVRSIPFYIVAGNHDLGGSGDFVNMLGASGASKYSGNTEGGDALAYFNNYYFPLNGPSGVDSYYIFNGDASSPTGWFLNYSGMNYTSSAAFTAYRASTAVNSGTIAKQQVDHMSNYSFDQGNAHFLFLDANPHLFNALVDYSAPYTAPPGGFPAYPSILRNWIVNDLDSSTQQWKFVVFHQPTFSSGSSTLRNYQMRAIVKALEDHGVNMVFNGHEHNYQRTYPIRALNRVTSAPTTGSEPAVAVDTAFNGIQNTVPDGVIYIIDGAGGNRDFDGGLPSPRGQGSGLDQEDVASGTYSFSPTLTFPQGPASWLDANLTDTQMIQFLPNAGAGTKITQFFKAKLFSFSDLVVQNGSLTLYQITEPLKSTSSASATNPAPFGRDYKGNAFNDPLPDTLIDPTTGKVTQQAGTGTSALMDQFTVTKPDVSQDVAVNIAGPQSVLPGALMNYRITIQNDSAYNLNGVQVALSLPTGAYVEGNLGVAATLQSPNTIVMTLGRLVKGESRAIMVPSRAPDTATMGAVLSAGVTVRSGTALPITADPALTTVGTLCAATTAPSIGAVTNDTYGTTLSGTGTIVVWGTGFTGTGGDTLIFQRPNYSDVWIDAQTAPYFWDFSANQINASLGNLLAPGTWNVSVRNSCTGPISAPFSLTLN